MKGLQAGFKKECEVRHLSSLISLFVGKNESKRRKM
jgi:hypothetical protein